MATYRLEAKVISRAKGRSATASAAYRAGTAIEDERTGLLFDYTGKRGVLHSEIMAPANTPDWMLDRAALWNAVERIERRRDAQLARDFILSLPHELTHEQRVELMRDFLGEEFVARGMIADFSIHAPDRRSDERNHHAHVMVTMRELAGGGFGLKNRDWNRTELLESWRERWADAVNLHLKRHGHEARVDHRSLEDQGIDREPEPKQGPVATEMERNGKNSHAGDDRRAVQARNEERAALSREADALDAALIYLDPDRPRGAAFEDVRDALEGSGGRIGNRRVRPGIAETDGGMVAQQREAMRRFRINSARMEKQRERQARDGYDPKADTGSDIKGRPEMVSRYDPLRAEQSKAVSEQDNTPVIDGSQTQPPVVPDLTQGEAGHPHASSLNWSLDQSMPAQNASAQAWAKASHEHRQEQAKTRDEPQQEEKRSAPDEPEQENTERKLRFAEDRGNEHGAERGGDRSGRLDLKREQSEPSRDEEGERKLRFARDRNPSPDLER